jgi:hypothetical protein
MIEVSAEIDIDASPADIAGVMFDPQREPEWIAIVRSVELIDAALKPGARVRRSGSVLGQEIAWTTEVAEVHFPHVLTLRIVEGPMTGTIRYDIQRAGTGTRVRVRAAGESPKLAFLPEALIAAPVRSAMLEGLGRLKSLVTAAAG